MSNQNDNPTPQGSKGSTERYDRFLDLLVEKLGKEVEKKQDKKFIDRIKDKLESALANVLVWGAAIVVAWSVGYVFTGKDDMAKLRQEVSDINDQAVMREAKLKEELGEQLKAVHKDIHSMAQALHKKKEPPLKPPDDEPVNMRQDTLDYIEQHSRRYKK
jgi:hypothetical protein